MEDTVKSPVNILVVDDEPSISAYLGQILSQRRLRWDLDIRPSDREWHVDTAGDGPSALELVGRNTYDFVVLDYRMPGMDGGQLCRRIRESQPGIYTVFLTGYPTPDVLDSAIEDGARQVLAKPVNPEELIRVLETQLV